MDIGVMLPHLGYAAQHAEMIDVCQTAEALGFSSLWVGDHIAFPADFAESRYPFNDSGEFPGSPAETPFLESFTSLGFAAAATSTIRLGTSSSVLPHRNPLLLAKTVATLDHLSGGRAELGVSAGWLRREIEALGGPFGDRGRYVDETIDFLRAAWSTTGPVSYHGDYVSIDGFHFNPQPPQGVALPMYYGGVGKVARRRALTCGGWLPGLYGTTPDALRSSVAALHDRARDTGTPADIPVALWAMLGFANADPTEEELAPSRTCAFIGTPDGLARWLNTYHDAGATRFVVWMYGPDMVKTMERFTREVRPQLTH